MPHSLGCLWVVVVVLWMTAFTPVTAQYLTDAQVSVVGQRLAEGASHRRVLPLQISRLSDHDLAAGSTARALKFFWIPPPQQIPPNLTGALSDVFSIAHTIVANRSISNGNVTGPQPLIQDSSAGDPASIGVAVLLANWTGQSASDGLDYAGAARDQLQFLLQKAPKTPDGAISHRLDQVQLWSDSVYMVPPFLAYYGVTTDNLTLLQEAYTQISLYRTYLRDASANNLWKHIQLGSYGTDNGHWSTGNAWAAAGMIRVLGTIQRSRFAGSLQQQQEDLASWIQEIHGGMYQHQDPSGLFYNYADNKSTFLDASSTALLASTVYRLSLLSGVHTHLPEAEFARKRLSSPNGTSGLLHFTPDGWLTPVADPYAYPFQGQDSPEGEAFVISMQAAWRDWVAAGAVGVNVASRTMDMTASAYVLSALMVAFNVVLCFVQM
ncbi:Six-hairpin glycosidase-like protein [Boletus reticuloceps]|uniref:Six-hairpin glycosidase-like protein n=1 Tax=Boletus reticuloceps TaxID=495285 RepID=A0A8I2YK84_9AGAM|nr:Six-hairpin glycosidase-like protein [Boletus reticuloceps]